MKSLDIDVRMNQNKGRGRNGNDSRGWSQDIKVRGQYQSREDDIVAGGVGWSADAKAELERAGQQARQQDKSGHQADVVNRPSHYCEGRTIEPIEVVDDWSLGFNLGNVVKYIARAGRKDDRLLDLQKAQYYLSREITKAVRDEARNEAEEED